MIRLTLHGLLGFDGVYDLNLEDDPLTNRELHWIKEIAGVRLGEFEEAADAGDSDLLVAFSVIALVRGGKVRKEQVKQITDLLWDAAGGKIEAEEVLQESDEESPPVQPASESSSPNTSNGNPPSSSDSSNGIGDDHQAIDLASTGGQS